MRTSPVKKFVVLEYRVGHSNQVFHYRNWWYDPEGKMSRETAVARAAAELSNALRLSQIEAENIRFVEYGMETEHQ